MDYGCTIVGICICLCLDRLKEHSPVLINKSILEMAGCFQQFKWNRRETLEELGQGVIVRTLIKMLVIDQENANAVMILMSLSMISCRILPISGAEQ